MDPYCVTLGGEHLHSEDHELRMRQKKDIGRSWAPKRIVICCDGTWQSSVSGKKNVPSNITRLCRALNRVGTDADGRVWQQVVWYDSGIGTTALALGDAVEGAFGQGLEGNVVEAYNFCVLNYNPGDKIMCFGFSRGAFTARTIAGLISDIGICDQSNLNKFPDLWKVYKQHGKDHPGQRFHRSDAWYEWMWGKLDENQGAGGPDETELRWTQKAEGEWSPDETKEVEVVGVYDTVGALGMPEVFGIKFPQKFLFWKDQPYWQNTELCANIKHAYHALALDESRRAFSPTLFYIPTQQVSKGDLKEKVDAEEKAKKAFKDKRDEAQSLKANNAANELVNQACREANELAKIWNRTQRERVKDQNRLEQHPELKQVWFPGYHVNVGGGSSDTLHNKGDMEEMSNIAFSWMLDQIRPHLSINEEAIMKDYADREELIAQYNKDLREWQRQHLARKNESWGAWGSRIAVATASNIIHPFTPSTDLPKPAFDKLRVYRWGLGEMLDSYTPMYWANGQTKRMPGRGVKAEKNGKTVIYGDTHEFIHPVVHYRREHFKAMNPGSPEVQLYHPIGKEFDSNYLRRSTVDRHGNPAFEIRIGSSPNFIEEWKMGGADSYERLAIRETAAYAHVDELEKYYNSGFEGIRRPVLELSKKTPDPESSDLEGVLGCGFGSSVAAKPSRPMSMCKDESHTLFKKQDEVLIQTQEIQVESRFETSESQIQ
ncbi:hypothetical protein N7523_002256 [Penicillium sp. IBT 18751x]|nr:hypothetical protein N7523_002256 [Penicillium sp. IBT 18751x]